MLARVLGLETRGSRLGYAGEFSFFFFRSSYQQVAIAGEGNGRRALQMEFIDNLWAIGLRENVPDTYSVVVSGGNVARVRIDG